MAERQLIVKVIGDDESLRRAMARDAKAVDTFGKTSQTSLSKFDSAFSRTQKIAAGGFLGGAAATVAISAIRKSVSAASDLNEQVTKNQQVFGDSSKAVVDWSTTTAKSLGVSQEAALEATGTFGNLFTAIGVGGPEAAETSQKLVKLASDLASFNNADPSEVLQALRSGLVGEAEPLRKFGVLLSEARVQQEALKETGKGSAAALTAQEKALARVSIIFADTAKAQGDFNRTSEGLANQQRILNAEVADLEASLGKLLLPTITELTGTLADAAGAAVVLANALAKLGEVKIPPIEIPIVQKQLPGTGGTVGNLLGKGLDVLKFTGPLAPITIPTEIIKKIGDQFDDGASGKTPELAAKFENSLNSMFTNALNTAAANTKPDTSKVKGFGAGLTPEDLFGPLITKLPNKFEEGIADAELAGKGIREAHVAARDRLVEALDDPRLKAADRIKIKRAIKSEKDAIAAIDAEVAQGVKDAQTARNARIAKAASDAQAAAAAQRDGWDKLFSALQLQFDQAEARRGFADDIATSRALEKSIQDQIKVEGRTPELLDRLFRQRQITANKIQEQRQAAQFRSLGLNDEGQKPTPTVNNLTKQAAALEKAFGPSIPRAISSQIDTIQKVLRTKGKQLTETSRQTIRDMLAALRGELNKQTGGPATKTSALNAEKILGGLGLGRDTERELRARLSGFNSAGVSLAGKPSRTGTVGAVQPVVVESTTTVLLDSQVVGRSVTIAQQKAARRNPRQKRGPNSHGSN